MDYKEKRVHGEEGLPVSMYPLTPQSLRYHMNCHWHTEHEIIYVRSGRLELKLGLGDELLTLERGEVAVVQGGTLHSAVPYDCNYICFVLDASRMLRPDDACAEAMYCFDKGKWRIHPRPEKQMPRFAALCEQLYRVLIRREEGYAFLAKGYVLEFFGLLLQYRLYERTVSHSELEEKHAGRMRVVLDFIQQNYNREIELSELARLSNMSPNYFCRYFRRLTGQTPIDYLITYRLESSCYALRTTDLTVTDIAFGCGFNDVSHYVKMFRKMYGMTPKSYRLIQGSDA
ncbi:MAG: helix-turn-helix domain-containing protein [Clostridia bacterium]|nr:helix-turn-helix domain-containing protein [Clostridia bacterium]